MTYKEIQDLVKLLNKSDLSEFKLKDGEFELSIRTNSYSKTKVIESVMNTPTHIAPNYAPKQDAPAAPAAASKVEAPTEEAPAVSDSNLIEVKSPMVGTFYRSSDPEKPPFVKIGDSIGEGDPICIIEAMKLFNEIESEVTGKIVKVLVENATPVEYDQVLFLVDPKG